MNRVICIVIGAVFGCDLAARTADAADSDIDAEKIANIWKARQEKVKTVELRCTYTTFMPKGSYTLGVPPKMFGGRTLPETDLRKTGLTTRILIDGIKVRHDYQSYGWDHDSKQFMVLGESEAFDGQTTYQIEFIGHHSPDDPGWGVVSKVFKHFDGAQLPRFRMLFGAFRAATPGLRPWNPHDLTPTGRRMPIAGSECIECLVYRYQNGGTSTVWLDPAKDYLVVRQIIDDVVGRDRTKLDITYRPHTDAGWVPAKWENSRTAVDGHPGETHQYTVESCEVNRPIDSREFVLKFPPGMKVLNRLGPGGVEGVMQDDGQFKPVDSDTVSPLIHETRSIWDYVRFGSCILLASMIVVLLVRYARHRSRASKPIS